MEFLGALSVSLSSESVSPRGSALSASRRSRDRSRAGTDPADSAATFSGKVSYLVVENESCVLYMECVPYMVLQCFGKSIRQICEFSERETAKEPPNFFSQRKVAAVQKDACPLLACRQSAEWRWKHVAV